MAKPTKPKDVKPKDENGAGGEAAPAAGGGGGLDLKFIILIVVMIISSIGGSAGSLYLLGPMFLVPAIVEKLPHGGAAEEGEAGAEGGEEGGLGMNLELDEFTVNLKTDPNVTGNQFLRAKVALSIKVPAAEDCHHPPAEGEKHATAPELNNTTVAYSPLLLKQGVIAGAAAPLPVNIRVIDRALIASEGAAADPMAACQEEFKKNMGKFVPAIRDVVNTALMKRTAGMLSTLEGQESLKDEIMEEVNLLLADNGYEIQRVNFEDFIIQK